MIESWEIFLENKLFLVWYVSVKDLEYEVLVKVLVVYWLDMFFFSWM